MKVHHVSNQNSVLNQFLVEIRDRHIQKDKLRFRHNLERIGEVLAYEMSKTLNYELKEIETVLGNHRKFVISEPLVICSILRAGLPMHQGVSRFFDLVDHSFVSAYRTHDKTKDSFDIHIEYSATSDLSSKTLVLVDPMLATGHSITEVHKFLSQKFDISKIIILSAVAASPGIEYLQKQLPKNTGAWIADIDDTLNDNGYIVPGLGDAGDLAFGPKL